MVGVGGCVGKAQFFFCGFCVAIDAFHSHHRREERGERQREGREGGRRRERDGRRERSMKSGMVERMCVRRYTVGLVVWLMVGGWKPIINHARTCSPLAYRSLIMPDRVVYVAKSAWLAQHRWCHTQTPAHHIYTCTYHPHTHILSSRVPGARCFPAESSRKVLRIEPVVAVSDRRQR